MREHRQTRLKRKISNHFVTVWLETNLKAFAKIEVAGGSIERSLLKLVQLLNVTSGVRSDIVIHLFTAVSLEGVTRLKSIS